tara:strand:- start:331 stop:543 length:213 start_codon:yes stop_codon:yes gene_type:complete
MTDKLNEMLLAAFAVVGTVVSKRIFTNQDNLSDRITALEKTIVTKEDLHHIERNVEMILAHLINKKEGGK